MVYPISPESSVEATPPPTRTKTADKKWWIAAIVIASLGTSLALGSDITHQINVISMKTNFWLISAGTTLTFVAGVIALAKGHLKTSGISWIVSGALLCVGTDLAHPAGVINNNTALSLDVIGTVTLGGGIVSLVVNYLREKKRLRQMRAAYDEAVRPGTITSTLCAAAAQDDDPKAAATVLANGVDPNETNALGTSALDIALLSKHPAHALAILGHKAHRLSGNEHLFHAFNRWAETGNRDWIKVMKKLVEKGADLTFVTRDRKTFLQLLIEHDVSHTLIGLVLTKWEEVLPTVIRKGGNLTFVDPRGNNLLHRAIKERWEHAIPLLKKAAPELLDQINRKGQTPAQLALSMKRSDLLAK